MYQLLSEFISLWIGSQYVLANSVLILLLLSFFIGMIRGATDQFLYGYGLFYDTWAPIVESIIYIIVAIIGGSIWGLEGVLLGGVTSLVIIVGIWKPYFLFSKGFKVPVWRYWKRIAEYIVLTIISFLLVGEGIHLFVESDFPTKSWSHWILYALIITSIFALFHFLLLYFSVKEMRTFIDRVIKWKK